MIYLYLLMLDDRCHCLLSILWGAYFWVKLITDQCTWLNNIDLGFKIAVFGYFVPSFVLASQWILLTVVCWFEIEFEKFQTFSLIHIYLYFCWVFLFQSWHESIEDLVKVRSIGVHCQRLGPYTVFNFLLFFFSFLLPLDQKWLQFKFSTYCTKELCKKLSQQHLTDT